MQRPDYNAWRVWLEGLPSGIPVTVGDAISTQYSTSGVTTPPFLMQAQLQANRLIGPFAKPMLVEGIRFRCESRVENTDEILSLRARVNAGPFTLTNDFIAPGALAEREQYSGAEVSGHALFFSGQAFQTSPFQEVNASAAQYTWRFDEPLYLPAGVPIRISLKRFSDNREDVFLSGNNGATASAIAYATNASAFGYYFPQGVMPPPGVVPIPYAGTFVDATIPAAGSPSVAQVVSSETDLYNGTGAMLYLSRMVGRLPSRAPRPNTTFGGAGGFGEYTGPEPLIRITRTYGGGRDPGGYGKDPFGRANHRAIVDPMKPFNAVFPIHSRALDLSGCEMPPTSAFIATILKQTNQTALMANIRIFPAIGLHGYRMEQWQ